MNVSWATPALALISDRACARDLSRRDCQGAFLPWQRSFTVASGTPIYFSAILEQTNERENPAKILVGGITAATAAAITVLGGTFAYERCAHAADPKPITIGFIYVGSKSDYGYNQAQAEGAKELAAMPGVKIVENENVPETVAVQKTMQSMIELNGASAIFATSYGYFDPHVIKTAPKYPNVDFFHCGGTYDAAKDSKNIYTYFGYIDECEYIAGIVAGKTTKSNKLGFIAAKPIPQVLRNINAFTHGRREA